MVRFECLGGPHDGLWLTLPRRSRNIIIAGPCGQVHEYLDMGVEDLSPVFVSPHRVYCMGTPKLQLEYSGWLTEEELRHAKKLAGRS